MTAFFVDHPRRAERENSVKPEAIFQEDRDLIQRAKDGDDAAKTSLLDRYRPLIESLVYQYSTTLPDEEREDLSQEASIAFFRALEQFDTEKEIAFGFYAKTCIANRLKDYLRKRTKNPTKNALPYEGDDVLFGEDDWIKRFYDKESLKELLARLSEILSDFEYRIWMLHFTGYSAAEIAAAAGKDRKSIENALARARLKIKKNLPPR